MVFEGVEAESPEQMTLLFTIEIGNPRPYSGRAAIEAYSIEINGQEALSGLTLENAENDFRFPAQATSSYPLKLSMDIAALAAAGLAPFDEYRVNLKTKLDFTWNDEAAARQKKDVSCLAAFPGVRAPIFAITAIAILKAELINTRFRVTLKIDNPNSFPMDLSAFSYELYGNGRLWADGTEKNIIKVPAKSSLTGNLFLLMNFINMKRDLLDQIINLEDVNYRFAGQVQVSTGVEYLPRFTSAFNLSGYSKVYDN